MGIKRLSIRVDGMSCQSCESRISKALLSLDGVSGAVASVSGAKVDVEYDEGAIAPDALRAAIENAGYAVKKAGNGATMIALGIGVALAAAYLVASGTGAFNALPTIDASIGYGMLLVAGLLTSVHCIAMCGGIALAQSVAKLSADSGGGSGRLAPGLLYNGGRVLSYTIIGGLAGALGSAFDFSPVVKGIIAGAAGLLMALLGVKMLGILPRLPSPSRLVPSGLSKAASRLGKVLGKRGPFAVGMLNGLMPCGPLQTMQLYALGTGSLVAGALSMFIFSIGTVPLMLIFSIAAVFIPRRFVPIMVKASAVLVIVLGVVTLGRAAALSGVPTPSSTLSSTLSSSRLSASKASSTAAAGGTQAVPAQLASGASAQAASSVSTISEGAQTIVTEIGPNNYVPFTVQSGVPLRWIVRVSAANLTGCNNQIIVPAYGIKKRLVPGDNVIEFVPKKDGAIRYSCWMGMIKSTITVVPSVAALSGQNGAKK